MSDTLVLSAAYVPVRIVTWEDAMTLVYKNICEVVQEHEDRVVRTVSLEIRMPAVIRYIRWRKPKTKALRFSRENIYNRDRQTCQYCGNHVKRQDLTLDHVVPRAAGGKTTWENVVVCCGRCNEQKGSKSLRDSGMKLRSTPVQPQMLPMGAGFGMRWSTGMPSAWKTWLKDQLASAEYWNAELLPE